MNYLKSKYKNNLVYKLILHEGSKHPVKVGFMVRLLFIPVSFKNYILPLTNMSFLVYFLIVIPFAVLFASMFCFIGIQLQNPEDLIETRDWAQKTTGERINFVFTWFVLAFSLLLIVWISCITKKKLGELKRKDELEKKAEI